MARLAVPAVLVAAVQIAHVCQQSTFLARDVDAQRSSHAQAAHVAVPSGDGLLFVFIHERIVDHRHESRDEPRVARDCQCTG